MQAEIHETRQFSLSTKLIFRKLLSNLGLRGVVDGLFKLFLGGGLLGIPLFCLIFFSLDALFIFLLNKFKDGIYLSFFK